jgi:hypothetical protein
MTGPRVLTRRENATQPLPAISSLTSAVQDDPDQDLPSGNRLLRPPADWVEAHWGTAGGRSSRVSTLNVSAFTRRQRMPSSRGCIPSGPRGPVLTRRVIHRDPNSAGAIQQPLEVEAGERVIRMLADMRREGGDRARRCMVRLLAGMGSVPPSQLQNPRLTPKVLS